MSKTYRAASGTGLQYGSQLTASREKLHKNGVPQDAVFNAIPTLEALRSKGGFKDNKAGGEVIRINIINEKNTLGKSISGLEAVTMSTIDPFTIAYAPWAQYSWPVVLSGMDKFKNGGGSKIFDLLAGLEEVTYMSAAEDINRDLWDCANVSVANGTTGNNNKNIISIPMLVPGITTNQLHGISTTTSSNTWWQPRTKDQAHTGTVAAFLQNVNNMVNTCNRARGGGKADLIVCDQVTYEAIENGLDRKILYTDTNNASPGFKSLNWKGCDIIYDCYVPDIQANVTSATTGNGGPDTTLTFGSLFVLNSKAMTFHVGKDFEPTPFMDGTYGGQDGMASLTLFYGQLTASSRRNLGVIYDIPLTLS